MKDSPLKTFYRFKLNHYLSNEEESVSITSDALVALNEIQKKEIALIYFDKGLFSEGKKITNELKSNAAKLEIYTTIGDFKTATTLG